MHLFVIFTSQDLWFNIGKVCTLKTIFIVFCPQTDFEKDVDMACRSGKLQVECVWFCVCVCVWLAFGDCCSNATDVSLCFLSVFWLLQIPQRCRNRCEACSPSVLHLCLTINITAASLRQGAVLTRNTAHYCCIRQFSPGWWEWDERVLSSYMQINRAVWASPTLPLYN